MDDALYLAADQNEVRSVRWPQIWSSERCVAQSKSRTVRKPDEQSAVNIEAYFHKTVRYFKEYLVGSKIWRNK